MTRLLFVDPIGGAAGDMLLAALLDAGGDIEELRSAVDAVSPRRFSLAADEVTRAGLRAKQLHVEALVRPTGPPKRLTEFLADIDRASLPERVRERARSVLERLGQAESRVHGVPLDEIVLHELGDEDTLVDVVGFAALSSGLGIDRILVGPLPIGGLGDRDEGPEGHPLPAPATMELLAGFRIRGGGVHETVTPTAAAIIAALGEPADDVPHLTLDAIGYGAGSRDPVSGPNVVRVLLGARVSGELRTRPLTLLEANLDDLTPELLADAAEALFSAGALDVWTTPVHMKKGRSGVTLSALCDASGEPSVRRAFFEATPTFGVRALAVARTELERRSIAVDVAGGTVRIKVGLLDGRVVSATPEHDDVAAVAHQAGRPVREVYDEATAAAAVLRREEAARR